MALTQDEAQLFAALPEHRCKRFEVWWAGSPARKHTTEHRANAVLSAIPGGIKKLKILETGAG